MSANNYVACTASSYKLNLVINIAVTKAIWHRRLGHMSLRVLNNVVGTCNRPVKNNENFTLCDACKYGKTHAFPFPNSSSHAYAPFELIHTDLWRPAPVVST